MRRSFHWRGLLQVIVPIVLVLAVFALWELLAVTVYKGQEYVLPRPGSVFSQLGTDWDVLQPDVVQTVKEFVLGFFAGVGVGFALAVAMSYSQILRHGLYPALIATQAVPVIAIGAALVIWLGFGLTPKIVIVALFIFFPVLVNVLDGLSNVDEDVVSLARAMGANDFRIFLHIRFPATLTPLFSALKLAATFAVTGAVLGEWTASTTGGVGSYLLEQSSRLNTAGTFAAILLLAAIGIVGFLIVAGAERLATPWRTRATPRRLPFHRPAEMPRRAPESIKGGNS